MLNNNKFTLNGDQWIASILDFKVSLTDKCMTVFHGENEVEGVLRFPDGLTDLNESSFTYSELGNRTAILLPDDSGHVEIVQYGNDLHLNHYNTNGVVVEKLQVASTLAHT
ncbi:TPA: hypothetical protein KDY05_002147 [Vibrio parahaemolyticus]|nr:hypothetical protein [Vibrio parahaemolyticus]